MYEVAFTPRADRLFAKLPQDVQRRVIRALEELSVNPLPKGVKKLAGLEETLWRIRVGNYRIVYSIRKKQLLILVVAVGHRSNIYLQ
jgi:mRNA interferase RelE/StbE